MTITDTSTAQVYDLSPLQRSALGAGDRRLTLRVRVPAASAALLAEALSAALAAAPVLTALPFDVPGLRVPRQQSAGSPQWTTTADGVRELEGGTFRASVAHSWDGPLLTLSCSALFADPASLSLLLADVASRLAGTPAGTTGDLDFLTVAQGHSAMQREGELREEARFWSARRHAAPTDVPTLTEVFPSAGPTTGTGGSGDMARERILDPEECALLRELSERAGTGVAEVAHLALDTVVQRLGLGAHALGLRCDAREVMGVGTLTGPLTQTVVTGWTLDLRQPASAVLRERGDDRAELSEMLGGPALTGDAPRPALVFDPVGVPELPDGWYLDRWSAPVDGEVTLSLRTHGAAWRLHAESCAPKSAGQLLDMLITLWAGVLQDLAHRPAQPLGSLHLVPRKEAAAIAEGLGDRSAPDTPASLAASLMVHLREQPDAPAFRHGDRTFTYGELGARVAALSAALHDVSAGDVVAVLADHEFDLPAAKLASLWRGAAFLPLSPQEPTARLADALEWSQATVVLTGAGAPQVALPHGCRAVPMADVATAPEGVPGDPLPVDADAAAYLLRTSGSTGLPKLVQVSRSSLDNYLSAMAGTFLADEAPLPVLSSPVFDASFKQTLGVLYRGGCVWLPAADRLDLSAVRAELASAGAPISLNCVPSYVSALLDGGDAAAEGTEPLRVGRFLLGGEALDEQLVRRIWQRFPQAEIWNLYGPTEATATATAGRLEPGGDIHVGEPIAGAGLVVVDSAGAVLPRGVRGEVAITGPGLALGYLTGHEGASPFTEVELAGRRFAAYRTGDIGHLDSTGTLRVAGRRDSQVKLNGWRIDLREIERVALRAEGVLDAAAVVDRRDAEHRLRLFVRGAVEADTVSRVLHESLPRPMVPESVTVLDRFVATVSGKVDRQGLLAFATTGTEADPAAYDPEELLVATAWKRLVGSGWPHPEEEFFASGGHSLLLARLVNQLRSQGHDALSLRQVVRRPTVASIAALMRAGSAVPA
ncbi:AMP-binding protein [Streptomyces sp. NBC_00239]|uniref:AMP-binding protein n=1 Tax=Streptomyces sp. NBC_00239 TaxID=2903640 RepID=UPI002E28889A|nr:AMP-binding protein [Streptomyces sp. NBC_00239]